MATIRDELVKYELSILAKGSTTIHAGVREHFRKHKDGTSTCKLCGDKVPHPRAAAAHMAVHHREQLEHAADVEVKD